MHRNWTELKFEIDKENARIIDVAPEDIQRVFKYDIIPTGAGTDKATLGVWFEGATAARYVGPYYVYNIIKLAMDDAFTIDHIRDMVNTLLPKCVDTVRLCGLEVYARFSEETIYHVNQLESKEDALSLLNSLYLYGSSMNAWCHHFIKWAVGYSMTIPTNDDCDAIGALSSKAYVVKK